MRAIVASLIALFVMVATPTFAVDPDDVLSDPALEARARALSLQLRCVQCQSQSIDDSDSPLAKDLRRLVRERIMLGDTDEQVIAYIVERYGDYVLLKPPVQGNTLLLWLAPILIFAAGGGLAAYFFLSKRSATAEEDMGE